MIKPTSLRIHLSLGTAIAAAMLLGTHARDASAGTCDPDNDPAIVCTDAASLTGDDTPETLSGGGGAVSVTTTDTFGFDSSNKAGNALTITGSGGLIFNDTNTNGSDIAGAEDGINASNSDGGAVAITTKGTVTGVAGNGIEASNTSDGTDLTISAAKVTGGNRGIYAENLGTGDLVITTTGPISGGAQEGIRANNLNGGSLSINAGDLVSSTADDGLRAINQGGGVDLTISAAGVSGDDSGILAQNFGTGDLTITTTGAVTGGNSAGIVANNYNGGAIFVDAQDSVYSAGSHGISAQNGGSGTGITISATAVEGAQAGIKVSSYSGGSISISATGAVTGGTQDGILARNYSNGDLSITTDDTVYSRDASGIFANNGVNSRDLTISAAAVEGGTYGIRVSSQGTGDLSITASGQVTGGTSSGIKAYNSVFGGDLTIEANGVVGGKYGIYAYNAGKSSISITATGPVVGGTQALNDGIDAYNASKYSTGITIDVTSVSGSKRGIDAFNGGYGTVSIETSGLVDGAGSDGIQASNSVKGGDLIVSAAGVSGASAGIRVTNNGTGDLSVTTTGAVTGGTGEGINAKNLNGGSLTISAEQTVTSTSEDGIYAANYANGKDLTITATNVMGGEDGIDAVNFGTGAMKIVATGSVIGYGDDGIEAINFSDATDLTVSAASVTGDSGIEAQNLGDGYLSVTATGTVTGRDGSGIFAFNKSTVLTVSAAAVSGGTHGIRAENQGTGDLIITATGMVTGGNGDGISAVNTNGGMLSITASDSVVSSDGDGIFANNEAALGATSVTISAAASSGDVDGIDARNYGTGALSITATGAVTGLTGFGIAGINYGTDLTISAASVTGGVDGIAASNFGTGALSIDATGAVTGGTYAGIFAKNSAAGSHLTISAAAVTGNKYGIYAYNEGSGDLTVTATGPVVGQDGSGILAKDLGDGDVVVTTNDTVTGKYFGVSARNYSGGSITVTAADTVIATGGTGISTSAFGSSTDTTISAAGVQGSYIGVRGVSYTTGNLSITTTGAVTGGTGAGIQAISRIGGETSVVATGPVTSASKEGIDARAYSDSTDLSVTAVDVQGQTDGIKVENYGNGDTSVTAAGAVTALGGKGITAFGAASTNDLTIEANTISSTNDGIAADHQGTGDLVVTVTGAITSLALPDEEVDGIDVNTSYNGANVTVTTIAAVTGQQDGIDASNSGTGSLSIFASGPVIGIDDQGIDASNSGNSKNLTIVAADVSGNDKGIQAINNGSGDLSITVTGTVTGVTDSGIRAINDPSATNLIISAAAVSGGEYGITAVNEGTGDLTITATGPVAGGSGYGIVARSYYGGAINITAEDLVSSGGTDGIRAINNEGGSDVTISAAGVEAPARGIDVKNLGTGDVTIMATGRVTGGLRQGITVRNSNGGDVSITTTDTVTSTSFTAIEARNDAGGGSLTISAAAVSGDTYGIKALNYGSGSLSISASGPIVGTNIHGILASNISVDGDDLIISVHDVSGGAEGIIAGQNGTGILSITATGTVTGGTAEPGRAGIATTASNATNGGIVISAESVVGSYTGIAATNLGASDLEITTQGPVIGGDETEGVGIAAKNQSDSAGVTTISAASVFGGTRGIDVDHSGTGLLSITATGTVTGFGDAGIWADAQSLSGDGMSISATKVHGGRYGISTSAFAGIIDITTTDSVQGVSGSGIRAEMLQRDVEGHITISSVDVEGGRFGIFARSRADGSITVTASGPVSGAMDDGIRIDAGTDTAMDVTVAAQSVFGGRRGIDARNSGTGHVMVTAGGTVTGGQEEGIRARLTNENAGGDVIVSAAAVSGATTGIVALNEGTGQLSITSTGPVHGGTGFGIDATIDNKASTAPLSLSVADVSGNYSAIDLENNGQGQFDVTVSGAVTSATGAAVNIFNGDYYPGGAITVTKIGSIGSASGLAVYDDNNPITITSSGALEDELRLIGGNDKVQLVDGSATGLINLGGDDDTLEIFGAGAGGGWDDADFSGTFDNNLGQVLQIDGDGGFDTVELFGVTADHAALGTPVGIDALALSTGTLLQANNADLTPFGILFVDGTSTLQAKGNSPSETTVGPLINAGVVDLQDGAANDVVTIDGDYTGAEGSQIWLDLDGDTGTADVIVVNGKIIGHDPIVIHGRVLPAESGPTAIHINGFGRGGRIGDDAEGGGIRLIDVADGAEADDFFLSGPVEIGIFDYQLEFEDGEFFLTSDFFDQIYAYENLPGAMQSIGLALAGQLVERIGVRSAVPSILPDANGNPVEGGGPVDSAIWARAVGSSLDSEGDLDSFTGSSFEQTLGFVQAGVDVAVLRRDSGRLVVGAMGHWGTSSLDVTGPDGSAQSNADFDFYGGGLSATWYGTSGLYFDNVLQYTAYDVDISGGDRFGSTSTDGHGFTASHELGYRIPVSETTALVPQAQITYQHIELDDFVDPDGVLVSLDDGDSLVGRLGLAVENSAAIGSSLVTGYLEANLLHEFLGDNQVNVSSLGEQFALTQDLSGTSVELGFGGTVAVNRGVSLYAEVDYTIPFDNGLQGFQALGGIRVNLNPAPPPPPPAPAVVVEQPISAFIVFFDWDRADLTPEANLVLDDVVVVANEAGYASIRLDGYTDLSGSAQYNLGLSERRANSVANGLIARGIAPDEIVIRAFGEENPLVPTPDGVREPQNRRVEIFLS
ncbi:MAG: autotransporter outer membrane beta-barrel domain-containing protein [Pseudomonadota bacterium]